MESLLSRSSSQVQDTGFSSRQQGFESPTGRHPFALSAFVAYTTEHV